MTSRSAALATLSAIPLCALGHEFGEESPHSPQQAFIWTDLWWHKHLAALNMHPVFEYWHVSCHVALRVSHIRPLVLDPESNKKKKFGHQWFLPDLWVVCDSQTLFPSSLPCPSSPSSGAPPAYLSVNPNPSQASIFDSSCISSHKLSLISSDHRGS